MDEWIRWAIGLGFTLLTVIASLVWWEIKRVAKNVHQLKTDVGTMILPIETDVRELQRTVARIEGGQSEAKDWRDMVLALIQALIARAP